jgi:hypothetical protein
VTTSTDPTAPTGPTWRTSSFTNGSGSCVELAVRPTPRTTLVRDTKQRDGGTLELPPAAWRGLLARARR